jgi:hypothetical protein
MIRRATGLRQATTDQRLLVEMYTHAKLRKLPTLIGAAAGMVQQQIARIIDQGSLPACVGCAMCAGVEAVLGIPPHRSWVRIWTDARRRDGELHDPDRGTWFSSAIESVTKRGLDSEEPGEWSRVEELTEPDDLDSEMAAYDRRQVGTERWRATAGDLDAVNDALSRGLLVAIATGVKDPYFDFFSTRRSPDDTDVVLTNDALGGYANGHEQRIVAIETVDGRRRWVIQNSWGHSGGCHLPDGSFAPGCAKVDDSVLRNAWDIDCIRIQP